MAINRIWCPHVWIALALLVVFHLAQAGVQTVQILCKPAGYTLLLRPCEVLSGIVNPPVLEVGHNALGGLLQPRHVVGGRLT